MSTDGERHWQATLETLLIVMACRNYYQMAKSLVTVAPLKTPKYLRQTPRTVAGTL